MKKQKTCSEGGTWGEEVGAAVDLMGVGIVDATNINCDGTVLALRMPIPNWSPGAIAFTLSHDCCKWTRGRRERERSEGQRQIRDPWRWTE